MEVRILSTMKRPVLSILLIALGGLGVLICTTSLINTNIPHLRPVQLLFAISSGLFGLVYSIGVGMLSQNIDKKVPRISKAMLIFSRAVFGMASIMTVIATVVYVVYEL